MSESYSFLDKVGLERLWTHIIGKISNLVPQSRTINGMPLSEDITLTASDIGVDIGGAADSVLAESKAYTDTKIAAEVSARDSAIASAKSSAISTAASDATTKANNALASAKSHTDSTAATTLASAKSYTDSSIENLELITTDDIDAICGASIVAASEVTF